MGGNKKDKDLKKLREENKKLKKELNSLKEENKKKDDKIRKFKENLSQKSVIERWKIGKYLHDNLAQQLTSAKISISLLKDELSKENLTTACADVLDILDESIEEVRDLSHDIIPMEVEKEGVRQTLEYLKNQAERRHGVNIILEIEDIIDKINNRKVATNLYHIVQEAIKNAIAHGEAQNIEIELSEHDQQVYLHIKDDGKGFDATNGSNGMGITIMQHRTKEIDGECNIKNIEDDDYATCVTCVFSLGSLKGNN